MHIEDLDQIGAGYDYVYLSPHLDDAALSCGGAIAGHTAAGRRVLIVTLCTAAPAPEGPFSSLAQQFHADWGLAPDQVVAARLREDRLAMERLGADYHWAGMLDAIYRYPAAYQSRESLFNTPAPGDPLFAALRGFLGRLRERTPGAAIYAPLGVGRHVDHLITHAAARDAVGNQMVYYEDVPYVIAAGALDRRLAALDGARPHDTVAIDATLGQKIDAIKAYASQLDELFGGVEAMIEAVTGYARALRPPGGEYGERLWLRPPNLV
jgi:LmbE family N-acetylglucosaminyl deacetylase